MEELREWTEDLREASKKKIILVEGMKDKRALEEFGVGNIIILKGRALFKVVEEVIESGKECIILFDLDKKGKELFGRVNSRLQHFGVKVDNSFREFLFKNTKLRQVEGLVSYLKRIEA